MKNVAVLFSGAKDSTFAIYKAINMGMNVNGVHESQLLDVESGEE